MKMRTLGRYHILLKLLSDEAPKRWSALKPGLGSMDSHALQLLLERGLVVKMSTDMATRGFYIITNAGVKVFESLESIDPITITTNSGRYRSGERSEIADSGYHWVEVECPMSEYWTDHFSRKVW